MTAWVPRTLVRRVGTTFVILLLGWIFPGCDFRKEKDSVGAGDRQFTQSELTFHRVYAQVFAPSCVDCHSLSNSQGGLGLATYEDVVGALERVRYRTLQKKDMPKLPTPPLTQAQINLLQAWIDAGAPRESSDPPRPAPTPSPSPSPTPSPSPKPPWEPVVSTFDGIRIRVLDRHCASCHNPDERLDFESEESLIELGIVVPSEPDKSSFLLRLLLPLEDPGHMPPGVVLERDEITAIHAWILHLEAQKRAPR